MNYREMAEELLDDLNLGHTACDDSCTHRWCYLDVIGATLTEVAAKARAQALEEAAEIVGVASSFAFHNNHTYDGEDLKLLVSDIRALAAPDKGKDGGE